MKKKRKRSGGGSRDIKNEGVKLLFVSTRNQKRSPTAEKTWNRRAGFSAKSAGISLVCRNPVSVRDLKWADHIFVMEERHKKRLEDDFERGVKDRMVHVLGIPEGPSFMDPGLIKTFETSVTHILDKVYGA